MLVETGPWLESRFGIRPGSPCEPEVEVETAAWLASSLAVKSVSPCDLEVILAPGTWLESYFEVHPGLQVESSAGPMLVVKLL